MPWKTEFDREARKEFQKLDKPIRERILKFLRRVESLPDPRAAGDGLTAELAGLWRYRVGDYRLICKIEDAVMIVLIVRVAHRSVAYKKQ